MIAIPMQVSATEYILFVALDDSNIERIKQYDPAEVVMKHLTAHHPDFQRLRLRDVLIGYANAFDIETVRGMMKTDVRAGMRYLSRGFKWRPDMGDPQFLSAYEPLK